MDSTPLTFTRIRSCWPVCRTILVDALVLAVVVFCLTNVAADTNAAHGASDVVICRCCVQQLGTFFLVVRVRRFTPNALDIISDAAVAAVTAVVVVVVVMIGRRHGYGKSYLKLCSL